MKIKRVYEHKDFGLIGSVELTVPETGWTIDGEELSPESVRHLATFALQSLQDAYAGAKTEADAKGNWAKKLDRITDGTIGTREGGATRNPVKARAVLIAVGHAKVTKTGDVFTAVLGKLKATSDDAASAKRKVAIAAVEANPAYTHLAQSQLDMEKDIPGLNESELPEADEAA